MKRQRKEIIAERKRLAKHFQLDAQSVENITLRMQRYRTTPQLLTQREKSLLLRAEELGLRAVQVTRRIANRMEQMS